LPPLINQAVGHIGTTHAGVPTVCALMRNVNAFRATTHRHNPSVA